MFTEDHRTLFRWMLVSEQRRRWLGDHTGSRLPDRHP